MQPARKAQAVRRGLVAFFILAGALIAYGMAKALSPGFGMLLALPYVLIGIGLAWHRGLARWAAMGACFWMIVGAFALPLLITVPITYGQFENPRLAELASWAVAGAMGLLGYRGLQYLRSPAAKATFASSARMRAAFAAESGSVVVVSAAVLLLWLVPVSLLWSEQSPALTDHGMRTLTESSALPDLEITGLCKIGSYGLVKAIVANRGRGSSDRSFVIVYSNVSAGDDNGGNSVARVPDPGTSGVVTLDRATNLRASITETVEVSLTIDSQNQVLESNERNNKARLPIVFASHEPGNLPICLLELPEIDRR
jgi:hypothetical protein